MAPAAAHLADRRTSARTDVSFGDDAAGRAGGRAVSAICRRPDVGPAAHCRDRTEWRPARSARSRLASRIQSFARKGTCARPLPRRVRTRCRPTETPHAPAARDSPDSADRFRSFLGRPANVNAGDGAGFGKDHGAAGQPLRACDLTNLDARDVGDAAAGRHGGADTSLLLAGDGRRRKQPEARPTAAAACARRIATF